MATTLNLEPPSTTVLDGNSAHTEAKSLPKPNSDVLYRLHQGLKRALPKNPMRKLKQTSAASEGAEGKPTSSPTKTKDVKEEDEQSSTSLNSKKFTDHSCLPLKNIHVFKRKQASPKGQGLEEKLPSAEEAIQTKSAAPPASTKTTIGFLSLLLKRKQASPSKEPEDKLPSTSEKEKQKPLPSEEEGEKKPPSSSEEKRSSSELEAFSSEEEQEQQQPPTSSSTTEEKEQGLQKPPSSEEDPTNSTKTKNRSWLNILKGKQASSSKGLEEKLPPSREEKLPATSEEDVIQTQPPKPSKSTKRIIPGCFPGKNWKQALSSNKLEEKLPSSSEETIQRTPSSSELAPTVDDKQKEPQNLPSSTTKKGQDQQKPSSSSDEEQQKLPSATTEEQKTPSSTSEEVPSNSNKTTEPSNSTKPPSWHDKHPALQ